MRTTLIDSQEALIETVKELGFLPFFRNNVPGFSLEERAAPSCWFSYDGGGVWKAWEWKGPVIRRGSFAYGKFFRGKAGFISAEAFLDFANYRRDGYDMDALYDDGLAKPADLELWEILSRAESLSTPELKQLAGYGRGGKKGYDSIITRLQMRCYAVVSDFDYRTDKYGNRAGWGIARYQTPERRFGPDFRRLVYRRSPEESRERILERLSALFPSAPTEEILRILRRV